MKTILVLSVCLSGLLAGCGREDEVDRAPEAAPDRDARVSPGGTSAVTEVIEEADGELEAIIRGESPEDKALARRVHVALSTGTDGTTGRVASTTMNQQIQVEARNGVITLRGEIRSEEERGFVTNRARSVEGVREVRVALKVNPKTPLDSPAEHSAPFQND